MNINSLRRFTMAAMLATALFTAATGSALAGGKDDPPGDDNGGSSNSGSGNSGSSNSGSGNSGGSNSGGSSSTADTEMRLRSRLSGSMLNGMTPSGHADFRWDSSRSRSRINVEVEDVNLSAGTVLTVSWIRDNVKTTLGTIRVSGAPIRGGELEFNTNDGQAVPSLRKGDIVTVEGPSGSILAGAL